MADGARHNRRREISNIAAARGEAHAQARHGALLVEAHLPVGAKIMALAGDDHIVIPVQPQLYRTLCLARANRRDARDDGGLTFLAAKGAAHAAHFRCHRRLRRAEHKRNMLLHFAWMLR